MNVDIDDDEPCGELNNMSLQDQLQLHALVFENLTEGMMITDAKSRIICVNPSFTLVTGYSSKEAIGATPRILHSGRHDAAFYINMWAAIHETGKWQGEVWNRRKNGEIYPEWLSISSIRNPQGTVEYYVGVFYDITKQKSSEEHLLYLAHFDTLTGLPNRALFLQELKETLQHAHRKSCMAALLFIDLDDLKQVNDQYGHAEGDLLLKETARRIRETVRKSDSVARLAGDEFTVILPSIQSKEDALRVKHAIMQRIREPCVIGGRSCSITVSVGVAIYPDDATLPEQLLRHADADMYHMKKQKKGGYG